VDDVLGRHQSVHGRKVARVPDEVVQLTDHPGRF
jgi:hypothetical protein